MKTSKDGASNQIRGVMTGVTDEVGDDREIPMVPLHPAHKNTLNTQCHEIFETFFYYQKHYLSPMHMK